MSKVLRFLKNTSEVLTTAAAVLAAAIVVVETYESLRKKVNTVRSS
jgi:predicted transcriptional regulator